ncbi:MAG: hypothetical protein FD123_2502 [Bacteroidetes bacterium]|nr:MAG: hypothetical protein FD123_2502 [Bacteroidota bacterium]
MPNVELRMPNDEVRYLNIYTSAFGIRNCFSNYKRLKKIPAGYYAAGIYYKLQMTCAGRLYSPRWIGNTFFCFPSWFFIMRTPESADG